jgi:DNA invertase Pin-like site-specific DNA recombinase
MALYGYARVSTVDQDFSIQQAALKAAGCEVIRAEKASGARRDGRTELHVLLDFLRAGDTLVVTRIDRLARSLKDLQDIVHELKAKGVALSDRAAGRHWHRGRQGVPRHARRVRGI